jgi:hypothetical protein
MSKSFRVKIDQWSIAYKQKTKSFHIFKDNIEKKRISARRFGECGMILFPAGLLKLIRKDIRHANTYDRLLDKFYEHVEGNI